MICLLSKSDSPAAPLLKDHAKAPPSEQKAPINTSKTRVAEINCLVVHKKSKIQYSKKSTSGFGISARALHSASMVLLLDLCLHNSEMHLQTCSSRKC